MILQRYISGNLARGWILTVLVLGSIFGLVGFIQEISHTRFDYNALAVSRFVLLTLPQQVLALAPVVALLGSIVALANMDRYNELTIISCTGFSPRRLLLSIMLPTLALMLFLWTAMEFVAPQLQQAAEQERQALRNRTISRLPDGGVWSTDGNRYIHLGKLLKGRVPGDISLFEFAPDGQLQRALHAGTAEVNVDRSWEFRGVREKRLENGKLVTRRHRQLQVSNLWAPDELPTLALSTDSMPLSVLRSYSLYREANNQPMEKYRNLFWQKLLMPFTVGAMILLATPISANLGGGRNRSFGLSLGIGALVGILFYLGAQVIFALGQLLQWSAPLVAALPAILVTVCALFMLRRMHW